MRYMAIVTAALVVAACRGHNNNAVSDTATATGAVAPADTSGGATGAVTTDTVGGSASGSASVSGSATTTDTMARDSMRGTTHDTLNQTQSGVTNGRTGHSTLGPNIKKTKPTQGQPVTAKGDTLKPPR